MNKIIPTEKKISSRPVLRYTPLHGINAIPIVDIFLILLIIFMISVPSIYLKTQQQMLVTLPQSQIQDNVSSKQSLAIQVLSDGKIIFEDSIFKDEDWIPLLQKKGNSENQITVQADEEVSHGSVIAIVDRLRKIGYDRIYIGVRK